MKNCEKELPAGYREVFTIDAANKKTAAALCKGAAVMTILPLAAAFLIAGAPGLAFFSRPLQVLAACAVMLVLLVVHELLHGIPYKLMTGEKLKFGFSLGVAYCGMPDIYVYRRTALISLLTPFTVISLALLLTAVFSAPLRMPALFLFSLHFGGCAGDLYDTQLLLRRFRDRELLMRDTGPRQNFYSKTLNR